jgi:hypothetical protein
MMTNPAIGGFLRSVEVALLVDGAELMIAGEIDVSIGARLFTPERD